jgi:hypothetical protein
LGKKSSFATILNHQLSQKKGWILLILQKSIANDFSTQSKFCFIAFKIKDSYNNHIDVKLFFDHESKNKNFMNVIKSKGNDILQFTYDNTNNLISFLKIAKINNEFGPKRKLFFNNINFALDLYKKKYEHLRQEKINYVHFYT